MSIPVILNTSNSNISTVNTIVENTIKNIFIDDNNIYVTDSNDILYLYNNYQFYPFTSKMKRIQNCFMIDSETFIVHHSSTISIFDKNYVKIDQEVDTWITNNIDRVAYDIDFGLVATLENGDIYVNFGVGNNENNYGSSDINRLCLNTICSDNNKYLRTKFHSYEDMKIISKTLIAHKENTIDIFFLYTNTVKYIRSAYIDSESFGKIIEFNSILNYFVSTDFNPYFLTETPEIYKDTNNFFFPKIPYYFSIIDNNLYCYHTKNYYDKLIPPLMSILSVSTNTTTILPHNNWLTVLILPENSSSKIVFTSIENQVLIHNGQFYSIKNDYQHIVFDEILINYDTINSMYIDKSNVEFVIDIEQDVPVIDQLINIIPNIYRLNNKYIYYFEQIDKKGSIVSYGDGVSRFVFNSLRREIDEILATKFEYCDTGMAIKLGKMMYFCNVDGSETFENIHPYFFFTMSKESDYTYLLKKFKSASYNIYYNQWTQYKNNPQTLVELGLGLNNSNDYIRYLMTSDLNEEQINLYNNFIDGYLFFMNRTSIYDIVKNYPISYYVNKLLFEGYFELSVQFRKESDDVNDNDYDEFCALFDNIFKELSHREMSCISQNVTGSNYYVGEITVVYSFTNNKLQKQVYDGSTIILEEEGVSAVENPIESIDTTDNYDDSDISYQISTCNTELVVNIPPNENLIRKLFDILVVEDTYLKN
ncbi:hypothetical protein qu_369 [Acanthamoeba polyphaga mimivirus]|nr:hypothetical protein [Mimivirus reunion]WMV61704.1 hypothetical protein qu_369 [Mimivirus sp.]WMV62681.1 hypothetical protein qu_369 [Acanthamoeba polyphaga mimivirus]WMV63658.1 hypothetical protein qu_369 [Mimivirus sp.]